MAPVQTTCWKYVLRRRQTGEWLLIIHNQSRTVHRRPSYTKTSALKWSQFVWSYWSLNYFTFTLFIIRIIAAQTVACGVLEPLTLRDGLQDRQFSIPQSLQKLSVVLSGRFCLHVLRYHVQTLLKHFPEQSLVQLFKLCQCKTAL